eukprot:TRINITY_DN21303_c1_g1_i1.p1 TRINITY_DN21303_c1_g1~~TRINITY_DN21303_c1_g1_i1.p1  ORF type:complete len:380 (+),score=45.25 TRINITY_DN21303_c1_g1_i1:27-1142(+)
MGGDVWPVFIVSTMAARMLPAGFLACFIVIGSWVSGPILLVIWTAILAGVGKDGFGFFAIPAYLIMFQLPSYHLRLAWWTTLTAFSAASSSLRLGYVLTVWVIALPVLLDAKMPSWPGYLRFMERQLHFKSYFRACSLRGSLEKIKPERSVFAFHPHGATSIGFTVNGLFDESFVQQSKKLTWVIDEFLRYGNPIFRLFCDLYRTDSREIGCASKRCIKQAMSEGRNIGLTLGGFEEATVCERGKDRVVVQSRKGIIKYCLKFGYRIHPVYTFGEDETYYFAGGFTQLRLKINKYKIPTVAFFGNPLLGFLPRPAAAILTYVGDPIECPKIHDPTPGDVDKWHKVYVDALVALFEAKKAEAGRPESTLEVF